MPRKKRYKTESYFIDVRRIKPIKESRAIVLIHGIGVSGNYFMPFAELLSQEYDVHVLGGRQFHA